MGLESEVSLLVASLDLSLVRLLRDAIRTADIAGGKFGPPGASAVARQTQQKQSLNEIYEPRRVIHPTDRYEPRSVIYPTPRLALEPTYRCPKPCCDPCESTDIVIGQPVLPPPWRMPVTNIPILPPAVIKVQQIRVDVQNKGSLLDVFL